MEPLFSRAPQLICCQNTQQFQLKLDNLLAMRSNRMLRSKRMYDVCFRAVEGLPLPARNLTKLIIESIIARLIKAENVVVCSYVWMANHPHIQLYSLDLTALTNFHERLKKRLTDHLKRLLGLSRLRLWDDRSTLAEVLDLDAGI